MAFNIDLIEVISRNQYRSQIMEILTLCAKKTFLTKKFMLDNLGLSGASIDHLVFFLESLGLVVVQKAGATKIVQKSETTGSFLEYTKGRSC